MKKAVDRAREEWVCRIVKLLSRTIGLDEIALSMLMLGAGLWSHQQC